MDGVTDEDLAWIPDGTAPGSTIRTAVPGGFARYALLDLVEDEREGHDHDLGLLDALAPEPGAVLIVGWIVKGSMWPVPGVPWDDPGDERRLYWHWPYRVRRMTSDALRGAVASAPGSFPDLLFPEDRSWLVSTLWDDTWRSIALDQRTARRLTRALEVVELVDPDTDLSLTGRLPD